MDWGLIRRGLVRYSLLYAGVTVVPIAIAGIDILLLGAVLLGLVVLLFVAGGTGQVRMSTSIANAQAGGLRTAITDPLDHLAAPLEMDLKLLFYGLGLLGWAVGALVLTTL